MPLGVCVGWPQKTVETPKELIRVAILRHASHVNLNGKVKVAADMPQLVVAGDENISLNGKKYRGEVRFYKETDGSITVINTLPLEEYLVGLVASEMPMDWPNEAIKAQSVAARTYAMFQKQGRAHLNYDVEATTVDQVYEGVPQNDERVREAVESTNGEILTLRGKLFKAFFHSTCGGQTETALNVWNEANNFHIVHDNFCAKSPHSSWTFTLGKNILATKLREAGFSAKTIRKISVEKQRNNPRAASVIIDTGEQTIYLQGNDFRRIVGYEKLKSTWFNIRLVGLNVVFEGKGYGHGVGMCQWGVKGMAESNKSYRDILKFYYPWARIERL